MKQKERRIKRQKLHRSFNSIVVACTLVVAVLAFIKVPDVLEQEAYQSEIAELINDEGLRYKVYKDNLGKRTIGFGHLMLQSDTFTEITPQKALQLLREDYATASKSVEMRYPWADGDVKLVLINMTYQMGATGVSKFKNMLAALEAEKYDTAAAELLDSRWARQTPRRAQRLTGRILSLESSWW